MGTKVKFLVVDPSDGDVAPESLGQRDAAFRRTNLQRTKSRSVECMKSLEGRQTTRKGLLKSYQEDGDNLGSERSVDSFGERHLSRTKRSQSYYGTRHQNVYTPKDGSAGNISALRGQAHLCSGRCGSTPPGGFKASMASIYGGGQLGRLYESIDLSPRQHSDESLIIDNQRQQEKQWMNQARVREEMTILNNIKKRELIEMKKKEFKIPPIVEREEPNSSEPKSILSGLLSSRAILLAPTAASLIHPTSGSRSRQSSMCEKDKMENWVPPPIPKPKRQPLIRRFAEAKLVADDSLLPTVDYLQCQFNKDCCEWHNIYRAQHYAAPLVLDEELCASAQYWANILAHKDEYYHQNPPDLGENLFAWPIPVVPETNLLKSGPDITGKDVAVFWYKKLKDYYFLKAPEVLHAHAAQFSQMVWASSKLFGCGKARSKSGKLIVVAHYYPKGNIPQQFHLNVFPPHEESAESINSDCNAIISNK